jgi:hypothetical protein
MFGNSRKMDAAAEAHQEILDKLDIIDSGIKSIISMLHPPAGGAGGEDPGPRRGGRRSTRRNRSRRSNRSRKH